MIVRATLYLVILSFALLGGDTPENPAPAPGLATLDLENLLTTPVTSVRRREESHSRAAGALYVITQEQIRRFGVSSIPEALRLVPGLHVARVGLSTWAISARGFNHVFASKLLVMVDGRTVYTPTLGGVFWDSLDTLIDDIDRIEVLRGPGAAMWGANAVNGVINIITKPAQRTQGGLLTVGTGSEDLVLVRTRYGGAAGRHGYWRSYLQQTVRKGRASQNPSFGDSRWSMLQSGFRSDWTPSDENKIVVQGDVFRSGSRQVQSFPVITPPYSWRSVERPEVYGGNLLARWQHVHRNGGESVLQVYGDLYHRDDNTARFYTRTGDADYQYRPPAMGQHELSFGLGGRFIADSTAHAEFLNFSGSGRHYGFGQATIQDDIEIRPDRLAVTLALRTEYNVLTGWNHQPTFRFLFTPSAQHSLWSAWSRSVRVPARGELGGHALAVVLPPNPGSPLGPLPTAIEVLANPDLSNEHGDSLEFGYRGRLARRFVADTTFFFARINDVLGFQMGRPEVRLKELSPYLYVPLSYRNQLQVGSQGWESSLHYAASGALQLIGTYSWLHFSPLETAASLLDTSLLIASSPAHQFQVRSEWRPARRWECDFAYFYYGRRINAFDDGPRHRADLRLGWRFGENLEFSAGVQNLTGGNRLEFPLRQGPVMAPIVPSAYVRVTFRR